MAQSNNQKEYKNVGSIPHEIEVGEARVFVAPGEYIKLTDEQAKADSNKELISSNILLEADRSKMAEDSRTKASTKEAPDAGPEAVTESG